MKDKQRHNGYKPKKTGERVFVLVNGVWVSRYFSYEHLGFYYFAETKVKAFAGRIGYGNTQYYKHIKKMEI